MELNYLKHHGIKGQKKGHRRYQYKDGSLTPEGRERYGVGDKRPNGYGTIGDNPYKRNYSTVETGGFMKKSDQKRAETALKRGKKEKEDFDNAHEDYKKAHGNKKVSEMSDAELKEQNLRLLQEKKYKELTRKTPDPTGLETVGELINAAEKGVKVGKDLNRSIPMKAKRAKTLDLSNMSDQEMRTKINRELLERQYNDVFNPAKVSKGRVVVGDILDIGGSILAAAGSAVAIAIAVQTLRKGKLPG